MKWYFTWIIRNYTARVDNNTLYLCTLPLLSPPGYIVALGICFGYIGLSPAGNPPVPGKFFLPVLRLVSGWPSANNVKSEAAIAAALPYSHFFQKGPPVVTGCKFKIAHKAGMIGY